MPMCVTRCIPKGVMTMLVLQEPKKLIRYRDNKIVSVKGEKYSEVKREESDDMKRTYVTLKPARQYRFH